MSYKWCVVPQCTSTSIKNPEKLFVSVPSDRKRRKMWLKLARRDPNSILSDTNVFMCEDHFDMEKDTSNYMQYRMGFAKQILLTKVAVPTKFHCQEDRQKRLLDPTPSRAAFLKRQKIDSDAVNLQSDDIVEEILPSQNVTETQEFIQPEETPKTQDKETSTDKIKTFEKSVQATQSLKHFRSKAVQTKWEYRSISTSPMKATTTSSSTSPFKVDPYNMQLKKKSRQNIFLVDKSDSDFSLTDNSSLFVTSSSSKGTDSEADITGTRKQIQNLQSLKNTMHIIQNKPYLYIGISKECYFLIQLLHKHANIPEEHILLCLKKIRLNSTFSELEDNFGLSLSYCSKVFSETIPILSSFLKPFIVEIKKDLIKKNLPIAFRHKYHNVSCIIDCLEIYIQKPSKALHQALTWSEYKKGNTVKYLVSCTPNGLVNYVSQGFGGRTSDVTIVENCEFLTTLPPGTCILADRGFKHLEQLLHSKGIRLLRPPSVNVGEKLSKMEVRQTKVIASLRIHVERVIRRIREFHMLKQHSVINNKLIRILDHVIIIACALINLQDSLIK